MREHWMGIMEQGYNNTVFIKIGPDRSTTLQIIKPESGQHKKFLLVSFGSMAGWFKSLFLLFIQLLRHIHNMRGNDQDGR